jgi:hypothetical protein
MILPQISNEQKKIIDSLKDFHNVVVDSVAGSGKTTTNLHIAKHFTQKRILLLTYNSKLKLETRERVGKLGICNMDVHSYHSFAYNHYEYCTTDTELKKIINSGMPPKTLFRYDLIVLDEAQDITPLLYEFVCKIFYDNSKKNGVTELMEGEGGAQMCIFGDKHQTIFEYNEADRRYMMMASNVFGMNGKRWQNCNLSTSFRLTKNMANYINECLLKKKRIHARKVTLVKPIYMICDCFMYKKEVYIFDMVQKFLANGYAPGEIMVLAPSLRSDKCPARVLENMIKTKTSTLVHVCLGESDVPSEELMRGKILFSTFHQTKGMERKVVFVYGFDMSYFLYYKKNKDPHEMPDELYVAVTRASEHLIMLHHYTHDYLPFIDIEKIRKHCDFYIFREIKENTVYKKKEKHISVSVTDLLNHVPFNYIDQCYEYLDSVCANAQYEKKVLSVPIEIKQKCLGTVESVSDITGVAIPTLYELKLKMDISILRELVQNKFMDEFRSSAAKKLVQFCVEMDLERIYAGLEERGFRELPVRELLFIANCWITNESRYFFRLYQIRDYEWLTSEHVNVLLARFSTLGISDESEFEKRVMVKSDQTMDMNMDINGRIDCIDQRHKKIYEFKCVRKIKKEHILQLAIYMYINFTNKNYMDYEYVLYNILTNEYISVKCNISNLWNIIYTIFRYKFNKKIMPPDSEFLQRSAECLQRQKQHHLACAIIK